MSTADRDGRLSSNASSQHTLPLRLWEERKGDKEDEEMKEEETKQEEEGCGNGAAAAAAASECLMSACRSAPSATISQHKFNEKPDKYNVLGSFCAPCCAMDALPVHFLFDSCPLPVCTQPGGTHVSVLQTLC